MSEPIKKVAAIHDLSGFGRGSLTAIIPTLSAMGIQVCPLPTAVLSNHTGFDSFYCVDLTDYMADYINEWKKLNLNFDCIFSGYLGSYKQVDIVSNFIDEFKNDDTLVVVDPVMADDGELYSTFDFSFVEYMRKLVSKADIITPNFTEAAFLLGNKTCPKKISDDELKSWLMKLSDLGPEMVVLTSVPNSENEKYIVSAVYNKTENKFYKIACERIPVYYAGTGDVFDSVMIGGMLHGDSLQKSVTKSVDFIYKSIKDSEQYDYPKTNSIVLEKDLHFLNNDVNHYCVEF